MFRFRTVRRDGGPSWIGNLIKRLHLTNLPQLVNVFRGEMALFAISTGGAAMEQIECSGLQRIPFRMFRFRAVRREGGPSWIGNLIKRLHLTNLPQLVKCSRLIRF